MPRRMCAEVDDYVSGFYSCRHALGDLQVAFEVEEVKAPLREKSRELFQRPMTIWGFS